MDKEGRLFCQSCQRELVKEQNCYCWQCMGNATVHLLNRLRETSTNDQIHEWLRRIDARLDEMERMLIELRINLKPLKEEIGEWASADI